MLSPEELQEIQLFLALLFPWDERHAQLYKTVTWTFVGKDGGTSFANYAAQSLEDLTKLIRTRAARAGANVYVALGTQKLASIEAFSNDGFPKAIRKHNNIVSFKSIYLDIDVGKDGAYATTEDAFAALDDFCLRCGLPIPTMEVYSGTGGLHVYWCTVEPIPFPNWVPLATALRDAALSYKLKCDPQVTVNPAGILRVPNTLNHKKHPPTKVRLYRDDDHTFPRYGYQQLVSALSPYMGQQHIYQGNTTNNARTNNFTAGVSESTAPPVSIDDVAVNCMAIDDILFRGGAGDPEPLWNLALYAASFTTDPHDAAHRLSNQDSRYSHSATEKKLDEKINARLANKQAGWPTCQSFSVHSTECAKCPLITLNKTPFHHARRYQPPPPPPGSGAAGFQPAGSDPLMPEGYWRNKDNHVLTIIYDKNRQPHTIEVINYAVLDAGLDDEGNLLYLASIGGVQQWRHIDVSGSMQPAAAASALSRGNGLFINPKHHTAARDFLVAWVNHLQTIKRKAAESGYGWLSDGSGFAFDDKIYREVGVTEVYRGKHSDPSFAEVGELKPWQDAMQLVYGNAPLETIAASAFAGPLVELVGVSSLVLSIYSAASGVGKSTAMSLAQAVWGHPRTGMSALNDTNNSMMKKIGDLRNLPIYWDELRTKDQLEKIIDMVFSITQGKGKSRLNKDITQAEAPAFTTMFCVASNYGIADTVYSQTEATQAGGLRIFEIEALPVVSKISDYQARQLQRPLQTNYGVAGARYAAFLMANKQVVTKLLKQVGEDFQQRYQFEPKERFWAMTMTTLICGAALANAAGLTTFSIDKLRDYLTVALGVQRNEMKVQEYATMQASADVVGLLQEMIGALRNKHLIITETIPYVQAGKPLPNQLVDTDPTRLGEVWMQLGDKDQRIRTRCRHFNHWLRERRLNPKQIISGLRSHYHITQSKQTLGSGVIGFDAVARFGRGECYDFTPLNAPPAPNPGDASQ